MITLKLNTGKKNTEILDPDDAGKYTQYLYLLLIDHN